MGFYESMTSGKGEEFKRISEVCSLTMEGICPSMREFKDNQEIELVIKVPLQDREGNPRD